MARKEKEEITCGVIILLYICVATDFLNNKALHRVDIGDNLFWLFENCCKFPVLSGEGLFVFIMAKKFYKKEELIFSPIPTPANGRFKNINGQNFNRLNVIGYAGVFNKTSHWYCECNCGAIIMVSSSNILNGHAKSCGCLRVDTSSDVKRLHGHATKNMITPTYRVWVNMKSRCINPKSTFYKDYGGRGITVCEKWQTFDGFLADMGERPVGKTLDRKENSKGYCMENCRWATQKEQSNNTRRNVFITYHGITKTAAEWSNETGILDKSIYWRIKAGWPTEMVLSESKKIKSTEQ